MKTTLLAALLATPLAIACDESKYDKYKTPDAAHSAAAVPTASAAPSTTVASPIATVKKKNAADCKVHPASIDFGDDAALETEVRRKLGKDGGAITPADLAQIKSLNLVGKKVHQIDPCIYPMLTSVKDLFLGSGEYDDLTPLQKLTTVETLVIAMSTVKDLRPIQGLKRMDRLDISHTLVGDEEFKVVGSMTNLTELTMDETAITDITPVSNLTKLEKLSMKKSQVKSLAPLSQIKTLKAVYIADTEISDTTPVAQQISSGMKLITK